ncbi:cadherin-like protein 26 isoform X2 [Hemibagrus wyckioides]|uniref:cadherin-like protein 26 isoform X2 n=1 Tax=Hemibagrus wyckioides TaxID=337641 RepID=UPI00266B75CC|nr:cadherin-like protein 26 isoform X2 [Hemibagrus wyckioides]
MKLWTLMLILTLCVVAVSAYSKIRQKRTWIIDSFTIEEENPGPFPYVLGTIHIEKKYLVNFELSGSGVEVEPKGVLSINGKTGEVLVHKMVDYEAYPVLRLKFEAKNVSNDKVDTRLGVEVKIQDINDHAPVFKPLNYEKSINESEPQGKLILAVFASDDDDGTTPNGTFNYRLVSTTPKTDNVEFYINQNNDVGSIYFKGCLDYEKAQKYTLLIEAKDNGDKVQLSSTSKVVLNVIDHNNHLPEITGHTGSGKIKERESGVIVLRLQVRDKDTQGSPAWKAKFTLHGDPENYFKIETDPKTNEGILTVVKAMDYEEQTSRNVSISVENEVPYFSCKVKNRTPQGLWDVETFAQGSSTATPTELYSVTIAVEDINDPPEFVPPVKEIMIMENAKVGTHLETFTAKDPDKSFGSSFFFAKGEDKDNWVTLDPKTGQVSVAKLMDRESPFVKNSTYSVIVYVVDNAQPPLTGTGTLIIHLGDQNDNVPLLKKDSENVYVCLADKETMTNITAEDLDLPPYSEPFHYELQGDVDGKWRIEPNPGTTVNLVREKNLHSGHYRLQLKISDNQGFGLVQNLSVTVCDCTITPNCQGHRLVYARPSLSAIGIMIFAFLLLLAFLLMALLLSCKHQKAMIPTDDAPDWYLIKSNIETPGTDCKMPPKVFQTDMSENPVKATDHLGAQNGISTQELVVNNGFAAFSDQQMIRRSFRRSSTRRSYRNINNYDMTSMSRNYSAYYSDDIHMREALLIQLNQSLLQLQNPQEELGDYKPHCYAVEGEPVTDQNLDTLSIPETDFNLDIFTNLDIQFNKLAAMCKPDLMS